MINRFAEKLQGFANLTDADIAAVETATASARDYGGKQDLIREGDQPGPVFVVLDGWGCRYKILPSGSRQITAFLTPGDCCDLHVGMLEEMDHSIATVTKATVATIQRVEMNTLLDGHPNVARAMYISQLVDEAMLRSWIVSMGRRSSLERLAHLMCELYLRVHASDSASQKASLPLSQIVLADALGMTPVHINRVLKHLHTSGAMEFRRDSCTSSIRSNSSSSPVSTKTICTVACDRGEDTTERLGSDVQNSAAKLYPKTPVLAPIRFTAAICTADRCVGAELRSRGDLDQ